MLFGIPIYILFIIIIYVVCAVASGRIAMNKGYSYYAFALLGLVTGVIGVIVALFVPDKNEKNAQGEAEALLAYKRLLDSGAITQEEFNEKKRSIMGK